MKRKIIDLLIEWKDNVINQKERKPILLTGAKGVGKTFLAYDFAKSFFEHITYLNFEQDKSLSTSLLRYFPSKKEEPLHNNRILILDEILSSAEMVSSILHLQASGAFPYILAISSSPIPKEHRQRFQTLPIDPMEFDEFLIATGDEWYIEAITNHFNSDKKIPDIVHKELLTLFHLYLQIGGMPAAINEYINMSSLINVPEQHQNLIGSYHDFIVRDNPESDALKMNQVFDCIPLQLLKTNKKFQYKLIRKGTTHAMYQGAIQKLNERSYTIPCRKICSEELSDSNAFFSGDSAEDASNMNFKLYLADTGLLYTKLTEEIGKDRHAADEKLSTNRKKALLENYMAQALQARGYPFAFWESDSTAKIDFIIPKEGHLLPIEIHCSDNTRSKSISVFRQKCDIPYAVKISSRNFDYFNQIKYIPYYAAFCI